MALNVNDGVNASKKALINYAIPMMIGAFVVAILAGIFKK